jgi:glycosyltransferase involved in cell wall biosynthesis
MNPISEAGAGDATPVSRELNGEAPDMSVLWAWVSWQHTGAHSGLVPLLNALQARLPRMQTVQAPAPRIVRRVVTAISRRLIPTPPEWSEIQRLSPFYSERSWQVEHAIGDIVQRSAVDAVILPAIEEQLSVLSSERPKWPRTRLLGISHQPEAWWRFRHGRPQYVASLDALVVVSSAVLQYWEQFISSDRLHVIHHGVDSNFFCPLEGEAKPSSRDGILRLVFSGFWLRDFQALERIISAIDDLALAVRFELIVPRHVRDTEVFYRIAQSPRVAWHADLSDEELRAQYRNADLLLLPLLDCTANNSLLEAMSCGLPVLISDVGGVRDYANESFASFVSRKDKDGMVDFIRSCCQQPQLLLARGAAARQHVEAKLSWDRIAGEYLALLNRL